MTNKHIPASKLLALRTVDVDDEGEIYRDKDGYYVRSDDLRALINETPEVEFGVSLGIQIAPTVILSKDFSRLSKDDGILIQSWLNSAYEKIDEMYNRPSPDLTNLVGELVEALGEARDEVANQARAAQQLLPYKTHRYEAYVTQLANIDALLTRAKEYLK